MTLRPLCFSFGLGLILLISCGPVKLKQEYKGFNQEGKHSRALYNHDEGFVVGGADGVYSQFDLDYVQTIDSLKGASDLRDVYVRGDGSMIFINSGELGKIWKVSPDGKSKKLVYNRKDVFLDGIAFWNDLNGVAYGDPINGKFLVLITVDGGEMWRQLDYNLMPYALPNEAGFAASGTGIAAVGESTILIGTGMADTARLYRSTDMGLSWDIKPTPIKPGDSYGIYSMYFWSENEGVVVGGSFKEPKDTVDNCFYTNDGGNSWTQCFGLGGYTSCVHGTSDGSFLVATGRVATYYSLDKGLSWQTLLNDTFYSVRVSNDKLYFSGRDGKISVYSYKLKLQ